MKRLQLFITLYTLIIGIGVASCDDKPYKIEMLAYDPTTDEMVYKVNTVQTISNLGKLEGRATRIRGGVSIVLDYVNSEIRWKRVDTSVAFGAVKAGGVYYPTDFDSLAMVSVYYNIEQSMLFFETLGMPKGALGGLDTYYRAKVVEKSDAFSIDEEESVDNAFYLSISETDRGFYILPFETDPQKALINGIPLSMNPGVITHEYSHAVFQELVYDKLPAYGEYMNDLNYNYLWALNEGIADIFAVALTSDPNFISASIRNRLVTRNASQAIVYTSRFDTNMIYATFDSFDPYEIGSFYSAAVYEIARRMQGLPTNAGEVPEQPFRYAVAQRTYSAISRLAEQGAADFEPADFFSLYIAETSPAETQIVCDVLRERFSIHYDEVDGCP